MRLAQSSNVKAAELVAGLLYSLHWPFYSGSCAQACIFKRGGLAGIRRRFVARARAPASAEAAESLPRSAHHVFLANALAAALGAERRARRPFFLARPMRSSLAALVVSYIFSIQAIKAAGGDAIVLLLQNKGFCHGEADGKSGEKQQQRIKRADIKAKLRASWHQALRRYEIERSMKRSHLAARLAATAKIWRAPRRYKHNGPLCCA